MTWEYRVVKNRQKKRGKVYIGYAIYEVYYDSKRKIKAWTSEPVGPIGDTKKELASDLSMMFTALDKPVLNMSDLKKAVKDKE